MAPTTPPRKPIITRISQVKIINYSENSLNQSASTWPWNSTDLNTSAFDDERRLFTFYWIKGRGLDETRRALGGFSLRNCYCYSMIAIILAAIFVGAIIAATSVLASQWHRRIANIEMITDITATTTITSSASALTTSVTSAGTSSISTTITSSTTSETTSASTTIASTAVTTTVTVCTSITSTAAPYTTCSNLHWSSSGVTVAGAGEGSTANKLKNPTALYVDENIVYICDTENHRIQQWTQCESSAKTIAGSTTGAAGVNSVLLNKPQDFAFDKNGYLYIADGDNHRVQRFPPNSTTGTTVAGVTSSKTSALNNLDHLTSLLVDDDLNIYILDRHNERVILWPPNATQGIVLISSSLLKETQDILFLPNSTNQVYISDPKNSKIYVWTFNESNANYTISSVGSGSDSLNKQTGMALDPYGNLYVADTENNRIVMYCAGSASGTVIATGTSPSISKPTAVALDSNLNLYVVSKDSDTVIGLPRL